MTVSFVVEMHKSNLEFLEHEKRVETILSSVLTQFVILVDPF